jgi:adenylate cyclase
MNKFLVVDDEASVERLITQRFRKEIRDGRYNFIFAFDGQEAIRLLEEHPDIDIVISDINMPRMDGLTLLNNIQTINPLAKTIMISAYGDMDNIRTSMNRGAFDFITKPIDFNDLRATLSKTLKFVMNLKDSLKKVEENELLKMYVNPSVISYLKDHSDSSSVTSTTSSSNSSLSSNNSNQGSKNSLSFFSEKIEATVAFVDICSFTSLSETLPPDLIGTLLNTYFDEIALETLSRDGIIDKFIGDAVMLVFKGADHLERAVETCLGIMSRIKLFSKRELLPDIPYPGVSIGVHSGSMVSGNFGSKSLKRLDFTVIGDIVNTAARIEAVAKCGHILVTETIRSQLDNRYNFTDVGSVKLRNKREPTPLFTLKVAKEHKSSIEIEF